MRNSKIIEIWRSLENPLLEKLLTKSWSLRPANRDGYSLSLYGVYLQNRKRDVTFDFCKNGGYGIFLVEALESLKGDYVFLDIGANIGLYSLVAEKITNVKSIHSFEPDPLTLPYLRANIEYNGCVKITLHPYALSNRSGAGKLFSTERHSGVSSLEVHDGINRASNVVEMVASHYLNVNVDVPSTTKVFAKIDVEGHELFALESLFAWDHAEAIDQLFIEFDTRMSDVEPLTELLIAHNFYEVSRVGGATHWDALWSRRSG